VVEYELGNSYRKEQQNVNQDTSSFIFAVPLFLFDFISQSSVEVVQLQDTLFSLTNRALIFLSFQLQMNLSM